MAIHIVLDPITLTLTLSSVMVFSLIVTMVVVAILRGRRVSTEGNEMYIGGESEDVLRYKVPSVLAMYWGIIRRSWRKSVEYLRSSVHTGILNDWYGYMSMWLSLLVIVAVIAVILYIV